MSILGITISDLKGHGWNNLVAAGHVCAGYFTAYIIREVAKKILKEENEHRKHLATSIGVAAGMGVSALFIPSTPLITFSEDNHLKLFAVQALLVFAATWFSRQSKYLFLVFFGDGGYFQNRTLFVFGAAGAILGATKSFAPPSP